MYRTVCCLLFACAVCFIARAARADVVVHDNGPWITGVGPAPENTPTSRSEGASAVIGFSANAPAAQGGPIRVADDFVVVGAPGGGLRLANLHFHAIQTNSVTTNVQFSAFYVGIYEGDPSAGGALIAGDFTTNRLISSTWTGAYRLFNDGVFVTIRPITRLDVDMSWAPRLRNGTYWIVVSAVGDPALATVPSSQTFFVTPHPGDDNAKQFFNGMWFAIWELPFVMHAFCPADFNVSHSVTVGDIFAYLTAWFAGSLDADFDGAGGPTVADIFAYLARWFGAC